MVDRRAVKAALRAYETDWSKMPGRERGKYLYRIARIIQEKARELARVFDDIVPLAVLREGFEYDGAQVSFGSFMKGIHRARMQRGAEHECRQPETC